MDHTYNLVLGCPEIDIDPILAANLHNSDEIT